MSTSLWAALGAATMLLACATPLEVADPHEEPEPPVPAAALSTPPIDMGVGRVRQLDGVCGRHGCAIVFERSDEPGRVWALRYDRASGDRIDAGPILLRSDVRVESLAVASDGWDFAVVYGDGCVTVLFGDGGSPAGRCVAGTPLRAVSSSRTGWVFAGPEGDRLRIWKASFDLGRIEIGARSDRLPGTVGRVELVSGDDGESVLWELETARGSDVWMAHLGMGGGYANPVAMSHLLDASAAGTHVLVATGEADRLAVLAVDPRTAESRIVSLLETGVRSVAALAAHTKPFDGGMVVAFRDDHQVHVVRLDGDLERVADPAPMSVGYVGEPVTVLPMSATHLLYFDGAPLRERHVLYR